MVWLVMAASVTLLGGLGWWSSRRSHHSVAFGGQTYSRRPDGTFLDTGGAAVTDPSILAGLSEAGMAGEASGSFVGADGGGSDSGGGDSGGGGSD